VASSPPTGRVHSTESCGTVDGPGIRFVVFLQGCPLRCGYCHNADTWKFGEGRETTVDALLAEARRYRSYMRYSGGGLTLSGGEPLYQPGFAAALLAACRREGIHTALDTSGYASWETARPVVEQADLVLLDLKCVDPEAHKALTGVELPRILEFARQLAAIGKKAWVRHVLVPGVTDGEERLTKLGELVAQLGHVEVLELLPFHKLGEYKWKELGHACPLAPVPVPSRAEVERALAILRRHHPNVR
jgi:pyruvate formate lyase activating enzyme